MNAIGHQGVDHLQEEARDRSNRSNVQKNTINDDSQSLSPSSFFQPKTALILVYVTSAYKSIFLSPQNGDNSRFIIVISSHFEDTHKCTCSSEFVREKQLGCSANIGKRC